MLRQRSGLWRAKKKLMSLSEDQAKIQMGTGNATLHGNNGSTVYGLLLAITKYHGDA